MVTKDLSSINRVHIIFNEEDTNLDQSVVVIEDSSSIEELDYILEKAKVSRLVYDNQLVLTPAVYYELYEGDKLVQTLMFNGKDTLRIFKGGLCYEIEYESLTLGEWYDRLKERY